MRNKIIAGNWKMNLSLDEAKKLAMDLNDWLIKNKTSTKVVIAPTSIYLKEIKEATQEENITIASQDVSAHKNGAYTGDVSAEQLQSIGIKCSIVGHSERREYQKETDEQIGQKMNVLYENGITPILCVGEKLEERERNNHFNIVKSQLLNALKLQSVEDLKNLILAYEPVWAIGTGKTASPAQAQEIHSFLRQTINDEFGANIASVTPILYGGSVNAETAQELFSQEDIDGGLVGGASLKLEDFKKIISFCEKT